MTMTNNPTIDGVSRDYVLRLTTEAHSVLLGMVEHCLNVRACMGMDEGFKDFDTEEEHGFVKELRALLDAPVVERQPAACGQCGSTSADICNGNGCGFLESGNGEPEFAALQSTIAQLQAENERLLSGFFQQVGDEDLKKISDFVGASDLPERSFFMRVDAGNLANMTMHMVREVQSLRIRITELESGGGEPVYQLRNLGNGSGWRDADKAAFDSVEQLCGRYERRTLYTAPPAPVAIELLRKAKGSVSYLSLRGDDIGDENHALLQGIDACLDATAALNTIHVGELDPAERLALARGEPK
jgi:hypothetical protein